MIHSYMRYKMRSTKHSLWSCLSLFSVFFQSGFTVLWWQLLLSNYRLQKLLTVSCFLDILTFVTLQRLNCGLLLSLVQCDFAKNVWFKGWHDFPHPSMNFPFCPSCLFIKKLFKRKICILMDLSNSRGPVWHSSMWHFSESHARL